MKDQANGFASATIRKAIAGKIRTKEAAACRPASLISQRESGTNRPIATCQKASGNSVPTFLKAFQLTEIFNKSAIRMQ